MPCLRPTITPSPGVYSTSSQLLSTTAHVGSSQQHRTSSISASSTGSFSSFGQVWWPSLLLSRASNALFALPSCALAFTLVLYIACGYFLLWWLTQYNVLLDQLPASIPRWFFVIQSVPVYCILARGLWNSLSFWSEWLLSSCLIPRRHAHLPMVVCAYTGAWYCAPHHRRRRSESPIRMPRLHVARPIPSVRHGLQGSVLVVLHGWSMFLSSLVEKSLPLLESPLNMLSLVWLPVRVFLHVSLNAAYLTWMLMVLLDLIVPPWYHLVFGSVAFLFVRWLLPPPVPPTVTSYKCIYHPDCRFSHISSRPCLPDSVTPVL
jgi:hypothetical protein